MAAREADPADIEALVNAALSGVAVGAFARGVALSVHLDARLPARVTGDTASVAGYLRRGLARCLECEHVTRIALALWRDDGADGPRILLEACRTLDRDGHASARLADLWTLPLGGGQATPRPHRRDGATETVMVALPLRPGPGTSVVGDRWRAAFEGRYMLITGDIPFDPARLERSLAAIGLEIELARTPEDALAAARRRTQAGRPVDLLLISGPGRAEAEELARAFRDDPRLAGTLIALAEPGREERPPPGGERLFDAVRSATRPWRRLLDVFRELIETREAVAAAPRAGARRPGIPDLSGRRILIAEDVEANKVLLDALLGPTGATVETVSGGEDVLARHAARPADLILMDLQMPGMGGIAATERVRAMPAPAGLVPIVALTAHTRGPDRQRALAAGMDAFLPKPVAIAELYELLGRLATGRAGPG